VRGIAVGDRVAYTMSLGSYAEYAAVPADRLVKIPDASATAKPQPPSCRE